MTALATAALAAGCAGDTNPLLGDFDTPFQAPPFDRIEARHYLPAVQEGIRQSQAEIEAIAGQSAPATFENTIEAYERSGGALNRVLAIFENVKEAETSPEMQAAAQAIAPLVTSHTDDIRLNEKLFERIKSVHDARAGLNLTPEDSALLEKTYRGFARGGANLPDDLRGRFRELNTELAKLQLLFDENHLAELNDFALEITNPADLAGLPASAVEAAAYEARERGREGWVFTLHSPSYIPFLQFADNRTLRETMYKASASCCNRGNSRDNKEIARQIANKRLELARLLGYDCYADYVLEDRMAGDVATVEQFLGQLHAAGHPFAAKEAREVADFARQMGFTGKLERWDWSYYSEKLRKQRFDIDDEMTRPYFELGSVQQGIFDLATTLYGITFAPNAQVPVYHPDARVYEVREGDGGRLLALLYLDHHPRATKGSGAWMTAFREQYRQADGTDVRPLITVVNNFSKPTADKPALLTFSEVQTFLHEFGHALHGILSDVEHMSLSGTSVKRDFVELPSQIMENWATEKSWLDTFARHYQTGEPIPAELVAKLRAAANFNSGYHSDRQVSFAALDMAWHTLREPMEGDVAEFNNRAFEPYELFPVVPGACMSCTFGHIFSGGYAAGYYGYKWAEVLDADAFQLFRQHGIFDRATAQRFRDLVLSRGDTRNPMQLYVDFRGQEPTIDALLERSGLK